MTIININNYNITRKIKLTNSHNIYSICLLNQNMLLAGGHYGEIKLWKINGDNLIFISEKEKENCDSIYTLLKLQDDHVISSDYRGFINIL